MQALNNEALIEAYLEAMKLQLDKAFIHLLFQEIKTRNMETFSMTQK